jgi:hypothetical protein
VLGVAENALALPLRDGAAELAGGDRGPDVVLERAQQPLLFRPVGPADEEALNPNEEEFGEERLKGLLREVVQLPAQEICWRLSTELRNWIRDAEQHDDLTIVVMKVN